MKLFHNIPSHRVLMIMSGQVNTPQRDVRTGGPASRGAPKGFDPNCLWGSSG